MGGEDKLAALHNMFIVYSNIIKVFLLVHYGKIDILFVYVLATTDFFGFITINCLCKKTYS